MKLSKFFLLLFAIGLVLQSCSNHNELEGDEQDVEGYFEFKAVFDDSNKTRNDYSETEFGFKNTWEVGDLIRIYATNGTALVAEFILDPASEGQTVGTFKSNGLLKLPASGTFRAVALSAAKAATLTDTKYPAVVGVPYFMIQTGNESITHIAHESILRSANDLTVSQPTTGTLPTTPAEPGTPGLQPDGSYFMGTYVFNISDFAVLAVQFTLPDEEAVTKAVSFTLNSASTAPVAFVLEMDDITAGQPITAYTIVPSGTPLAGNNVEIGVGTNNEYYQYQQGIAPEAPATAQGGTRYMKILDNADIIENPAFYLRALEANIQAANRYAYNGTTLPYMKSGKATDALNLDYKNTIINLINNDEITILDDATPALALYTPGIRCAFNARETSHPDGDDKFINVIFPNIISFISAATVSGSLGTPTLANSSYNTVDNIDTGCFNNVTTIKGISAPNATGSVGSYAFSGCSAMATVDLPNITAVNGYAFNATTSLKELSLPKVTNIGAYGLVNTFALETLNLPKVNHFENYAFAVVDNQSTSNLTMTLGTGLNLDDSSITYYAGYGAFYGRCKPGFMTQTGTTLLTTNPNAGLIDLELAAGYGIGYGTNNTAQNLYFYRAPGSNNATSNSGYGNSQSQCRWSYTTYGNPSVYYMRVTADDTYSATGQNPGGIFKYWWVRGEKKALYYSGETGSSVWSPPHCGTQTTGYCCTYTNQASYTITAAYGPFNSIIIKGGADGGQSIGGQGNGNGGIFKPGQDW